MRTMDEAVTLFVLALGSFITACDSILDHDHRQWSNELERFPWNICILVANNWCFFIFIYIRRFQSVQNVTYSVNCFGRTNGVYKRDCKTFTKCVNGVPIVLRCAKNTVFNEETQRCEYIFNIPPPCGAYRECSRLRDGAYPDIEQKCMTFYLCINHQLVMDTVCPTGLVFNVGNQVCDWPFNVTEPCGIL